MTIGESLVTVIRTQLTSPFLRGTKTMIAAKYSSQLNSDQSRRQAHSILCFFNFLLISPFSKISFNSAFTCIFLIYPLDLYYWKFTI